MLRYNLLVSVCICAPVSYTHLLGFMYSTKGAITVSVSDMTVPEEKPALLAKADEKVSQIQSLYNRGLLSNAEREKEVIAVWDRTTKEVTDALMNGLDERCV